MNEEQREKFFDLLTKKAVYGLDTDEQGELDTMEMNAEEVLSLEMTVAAISMIGLPHDEPMPTHLYKRILADAEHVWAGEPALPEPSRYPIHGADTAEASSPGGMLSWLGWLAAAAACIALALNLYFTRIQPTPEIVKETPRIEQPPVFTPAQLREQLLASPSIVRASWAGGNVKELKQVSGDVVWSDEKQTGYMRFRGLPVNDVATCYQLWIFDKTQDPKRPIDGGVFDVSSEGEVVIPIDAKLRAEGAYQFAVTIEKKGGVVVSDKEKIAALAKVQAPTV
ncbi:MAG: anti-sigma factor [Pyrinomonadaceae bacterium]